MITFLTGEKCSTLLKCILWYCESLCSKQLNAKFVDLLHNSYINKVGIYTRKCIKDKITEKLIDFIMGKIELYFTLYEFSSLNLMI